MHTSNQTKLRSQVKRSCVESSVHMSVLGMDAGDYDVTTRCCSEDMSRVEDIPNSNKAVHEASLELGILPSKSETAGGERDSIHSVSTSTLPSRSPTKSTAENNDGQPLGPSTDDNPYWWGKLLWGKTSGEDGDNDDTSTQYQSLEAPDGEGPPQRMRIVMAAMGRDRQSPSSGLDSSSKKSTSTVEDRLKQDCSFFYQGIDDHPRSSRNQLNPLSMSGGGLRPLTSALNHSLPHFMYSREGSRFRAHYERLNQDIVNPDNDDLFLDEYQGRQDVARQNSSTRDVIDFSSTANASQNTGKLSTLFFEQDGRLLMKLPRDQIRLIMDQDLEPGIISVEQWRKVDRAHFNPVGPSVGDDDSRMNVLEDNTTIGNKVTQPPPLRYVMTVPDDLYQRVVAEMSYALLPPCWGIFNCCNATDGKADIKLALVILAVILFLMFISTMVWPTD